MHKSIVCVKIAKLQINDLVVTLLSTSVLTLLNVSTLCIKTITGTTCY